MTAASLQVSLVACWLLSQSLRVVFDILLLLLSQPGTIVVTQPIVMLSTQSIKLSWYAVAGCQDAHMSQV
jgi:hypothetical protein